MLLLTPRRDRTLNGATVSALCESSNGRYAVRSFLVLSSFCFLLSNARRIHERNSSAFGVHTTHMHASE